MMSKIGQHILLTLNITKDLIKKIFYNVHAITSLLCGQFCIDKLTNGTKHTTLAIIMMKKDTSILSYDRHTNGQYKPRETH